MKLCSCGKEAAYVIRTDLILKLPEFYCKECILEFRENVFNRKDLPVTETSLIDSNDTTSYISYK